MFSSVQNPRGLRARNRSSISRRTAHTRVTKVGRMDKRAGMAALIVRAMRIGMEYTHVEIENEKG
ncbi:MAG: hypothetical protein OJF49_003395 [Ktedonobacterales bacterium]|nr:MAG: hypothetical protein OJF49_003395 [Ktedonobacterales bacterium]